MDIESLLKDIKSQLEFLLKNQIQLFSKIETDIDTFVKLTEQKIIKWQNLYAEGNLDEEDLKWLLKSQKDLLVLEGLKNLGLSQIKINKLKNDILNILFKAIISYALK